MARSDNRTERPTPRRLRKAKREGQIARSREIGAFGSIATALVAFHLVIPGVAGGLARASRDLLATAGAGDLGAAGARAAAMLGAALAPFLLLALAAGLAGGVAQAGFTWAPEAAKPKLANLSLKRGMRRFKPSVMFWELARAALKLGLLAALAWAPLTAFVRAVAAPHGLVASLAATWDQVGGLLARATLLAAVVAGADYAIAKHRHGKELRMTRQEVRQDAKESEGDPLTRAQRRRRAQELSRNRMISDVAIADVVVTNPTHLAVALRYGAGYPAPQVVAKGGGRLAARIRAEAHRHGVPVLEDRPLARTLFRRTSVGSYVPAALYEAVAVVLAAAYRRRRRRSA